MFANRRVFLGAMFIGLGALAACAGGDKKSAGPKLPVLTLEEAIASEARSPAFKVRDQYRNPLATLQFFEVSPEMSVIEIWPSGGWYTQILAPYLGAKGKYIIADPAADPNGYTTKRTEWLAAHPDVAASVTKAVFMPEAGHKIVPDGTVDRVLTFRNVHNWKGDEAQEQAFVAFYAALKPGGILGVVEHRAAKEQRRGRKFDPSKGYVQEARVIAMAEKAGFKLVASSEINANAKDTKNYPKGVWTLPPTFADGEKNRARYTAIGESDRMTLKFQKP